MELLTASAAEPLVRRLYDALAAGDEAGVRAVLSSDFEQSLQAGLPFGVGGRRSGPDAAIREGWWALGKHFAVRAEPERWSADGGGRLTVEGRYRGAARSTRRPIDTPFSHQWTESEGRLSALEQRTDATAWTAALR